ncbi:hypothetical protein [Arthrobacter sp. MP_2.3]|uniref:hypothetical protein n=1 Tax=Arthrobacter sp. MP_2.3 TaxID=3349633 RepID=UPI0038D393F9
MSGPRIPRPFSPTDPKRERDELARRAERSDGALWVQAVTTAGDVTTARAELQDKLEETAAVLQDADAQIAAAQVESDAARAELAVKLAENDAAQAELAGSMDTLKTVTLPALNTDLAAAQGRLDTAQADLTTAFGQLGTVDSRVAAARAAAIAAAAADATLKKEQAEANAAIAASADAKAKADAAQAAALAAAKTYADAQASGAGASTLAAAKADATAKADAAKAAAIAAAATDATAKKEQAEANAALDAKTKADAAQAAAIAAAKTDATTKADAAKAAAIAVAAADATLKKEQAEANAAATASADAKVKADAAQAAALAAAKTYADAQDSGANATTLAAAKADATAKADAAKAAAITAAAADATAKKEQAEANAALDAKAKADAALVAAKADATTKADAAQAAATTAAALNAKAQAEAAEARAATTAAADAKTKADAAQAAALAAAKTYADAQDSGANASTLAAAKADATAKADAAKAAAITAAALDATAKKEQAEANAAADASAKADAAQAAATAAQAYSLNPSFDDWTGAVPARFTAYGTGPTKETAIFKRGPFSARFNCADATTNRGLNLSGGALSAVPAPNLEYWTAELTFQLVSGSLSGAGILLDWVGMTGNRVTLNLAAEIPNPTLGKWYTLTKTLRRPTNAAGTWTAMAGYLMGNYVGNGAMAVKDLVIDWLNIRPATNEEISSYGAPALIDAKASAAQDAAIAAAALDATAKADAAKAAALTAAATDAKTKADAAQAAAITAAAATAQIKADAAKDGAISTAEATAIAKANAAQAAATAVANTAQAAADAAKTAAAAAQGTADTAKTNAATAQSAANAAQGTATTAATAAGTAQAAADKARAVADAAIAQAVNILPDASFENGGDRWSAQAAWLSYPADAGARTGAKVLQMVAPSTNYQMQPQVLDFTLVTPGDIWQFSGWVRVVGAIPTAGNVRLAPITKSSTGGLGYPAVVTLLPADMTTSWQYIVGTYTVPASVVAMRFRIRGDEYLTPGCVIQFDDVDMRNVTAIKAAETAVAAAQAKADLAHTLAGSADANAQTAIASASAAQNSANNVSKNLSGTGNPAGTAPFGSVWFKVNGTGEVIGQWQQTAAGIASTWTPRPITSEAISNLDVGKLVASTGVIADAVLQKVAAGTASIQKADVGNLTVTGTSKLADLVAQQIAADSGKYISLAVGQLTAGTGSMAVGVIDKLYADVVNSRKMYGEQLILGSPQNVIPDPMFTDAGMTARRNTNSSQGVTVDATTGDLTVTTTSTGSQYFRPTGVTQTAATVKDWIKVEPGQIWRFTVGLRAMRGAGDIRVTARTADGAGTVTVPGSPKTFAAGDSTPVLEFTVPAGAYYLLPEIRTAGGTVGPQYIVRGSMSLKQVIDSSLVATGQITAPHIVASEEMSSKLGSFLKVTAGMLEANLALLSKIIAGDPNGTRAEMAPDGFRVWAAGPNGGPATEAVRLGISGTDDYLALMKADGLNYAATMSQDGKISGAQLHASDQIVYKGTELQTILDRMPRGFVDGVFRTTNATNPATAGGTGIPFLRLETTLEINRVYRISTSAIRALMGANSKVTIGLSYRFDAIADMTNKTTLANANVFADTESAVLTDLFSYTTGAAKRTVSFLLWWSSAPGSTNTWLAAANDARASIIVEDIGSISSLSGTGVWLDGTGTPPPAKNTYEKDYPAWTSQNYQGNNAQYAWEPNRMVQGLSPAGYGNTKSIALIPDITADLAGATINWIRVYFYFDSWYWNAGGTARIALHPHQAIPTTYSISGVVVTSDGWPRPGARWIDIPSQHWANFKSGAYRGIALEGDGTLNTYGIAQRPVVKINYTK